MNELLSDTYIHMYQGTLVHAMSTEPSSTCRCSLNPHPKHKNSITKHTCIYTFPTKSVLYILPSYLLKFYKDDIDVRKSGKLKRYDLE